MSWPQAFRSHKLFLVQPRRRSKQNGHESLSTWGLLKDESKPTIMDWISQLVHQGFLEKSGEYNVLKITSEGGRLLKGEIAPRLLRMRPKDSLSRDRKTRTQVDPHSWDGVDRDLFNALRTLRTQKANDLGLPPYLVFGDAALRDMARRRPSTPEGFLKVSGVGKKKCDDFGDEFTATSREHCESKKLSMDVTPSMTASTAKSPPPAKKPGAPSPGALAAFPMFRDGLSVADVSSRLARAESTVRGYLNQFLESEKITDPSPWVNQPLVERIERAIAVVGDEGPLRPVFEHLEGSVSYDAIHVVVRCWRNRQAT
jgi:ATP-dependent DNA helicase RecQ